MKNDFGQFSEDAYELFLEMATEEYAQRIDKDKMACNKPRRLNDGSGKSHVVKACYPGAPEGGKLIKFGQKGVKGSPPKKGESEAYRNRRKSFMARHGKNIKKGKSSAAYWSARHKW
jgi:hypothetical protein